VSPAGRGAQEGRAVLAVDRVDLPALDLAGPGSLADRPVAVPDSPADRADPAGRPAAPVERQAAPAGPVSPAAQGFRAARAGRAP